MSESKEKEELRRKASFVLWKLKKALAQNIKDCKIFLDKINAAHEPGENNLTAVQLATYKAIDKRIYWLEKEYDKEHKLGDAT